MTKNADYYDRYIKYIKGCGYCKIQDFDEDWDPVGPQIRSELVNMGRAIEKHGTITLNNRYEAPKK